MVSNIKNTPQHLSLITLHVAIVCLLGFPLLEGGWHCYAYLSPHFVVEFRVESLVCHVDGVNVLPEGLEVRSSEEILNTVVREEQVHHFLGLS